MSAINDGGPAFPVPPGTPTANGQFVYADPGMTLRDWFAGQALQGVIAAGRFPEDPDIASRTAYLFADAMLAARKEATT